MNDRLALCQWSPSHGLFTKTRDSLALTRTSDTAQPLDLARQLATEWTYGGLHDIPVRNLQEDV